MTTLLYYFCHSSYAYISEAAFVKNPAVDFVHSNSIIFPEFMAATE